MKINKGDELNNYLVSLMDVNDLNMSLADLYLSVIGNIELINEKEIGVLVREYNCDVNEIMLSKICEYWDIDFDNEENEDIYLSIIEPSIRQISLEKYKNNPYYQTIKISDVKDGDYELIYDTYKAYELFPLKDIEVDNGYVEHSSLGYFKEDFPFIALNYKNETWMSITPNEIETMEPHIKKAFGHVIVFGLGVGYYSFMISLKEEVKKITIIEKDKKIINLFNKYILPQFPHQEKIQIVEGDAYQHMQDIAKYDFAFIDLWHNPNDGIEIFLDFKRAENINTKYSYWLEDSFYAYLRRAFITLLIEQLDGQKEDAYLQIDNEFDRIINRYYFQTKNLCLSTVEEVKDLLSDDKLLSLIL